MSFFVSKAANSHGPLAVARALDIDIELVNAYGKTRTEEFIKMNPAHCCPTIELDDGSAIWESNAVMRALCYMSPKGETLYPTKDPIQKGKIDMALDWRQTSMYTKIGSIGYGIFGMPTDAEKAQKDFKALMDEVFPILTGVFLKNTKFVFSDTPTIADLSIAPPLNFIKARSKFWAKVPQEIKDYQARVLEAFPATKENFDSLSTMAEGFSGDGADLEPLE